MLNIYTSVKKAKAAGYEVKNEIDIMFNIRAEDDMKHQYEDAVSTRILERIEGMKSRKGNRIDGKFGEVSLYDISTGGKGCLLAVNYKDFIIDAAQLGKNCLKLLLELTQSDNENSISINIVYQEPLYIFEGFRVLINGKKYEGYEASKAMEDAIYLEEDYDDESF